MEPRPFFIGADGVYRPLAGCEEIPSGEVYRCTFCDQVHHEERCADLRQFQVDVARAHRKLFPPKKRRAQR